MRTLKTLPANQHSSSSANQQRLSGRGRGASGRGARGGSPAATAALSEPRGAVVKLLGRVGGVRRMNAIAKDAVARTYAEILRRRHPGTQWIVRPVERAQDVGSAAGSGQVVRRLAMPENPDALAHGGLEVRAANDDAVDPGAQ
jgi:hypothetical protein